MEIQIAQDALSSLLSRAQSVIDRKSTRAILENLLLDASDGVLRVSATDLRISLVQRAQCTVLVPGSVAVPARKLHEIVREMAKGQVTVQSHETQRLLTVSCGKAVFHLPWSPSDEYPTLPSSPTDLLPLSASTFRTMIDKTIFAASSDESRIFLTGVFLKEWKDPSSRSYLRMVATDGHRLTLVDREIDRTTALFSNGVIIPKKALAELKTILDQCDDDFLISLADNQLHVAVGTTFLSVVLIDSVFPNYEQVIPSEIKYWVALNRAELMNALKRVSLLSDEDTRTVVLQLEGDNLIVSSDSSRFGDAREDLQIQYDGPTMRIAFNALYFMDLLRAMDGSEIRIGITDSLAPCLVRSAADSNYISVIMPMRID